jgi:hypothetical protein
VLNYNPSPFVEPPDEDKLAPPSDKNFELDIDEGLLSSLETWFNADEKRVHDKVTRYTQSLASQETALLKAKNYGYILVICSILILFRRDVDISVHRTNPLEFNDSLDFTPSRLLLSQLGLGALTNYENFFAVQKFNSPETKFNYLQNFNLIDKSKE